MLITPAPGADRQYLVKALKDVLQAAENTRTGGDTPYMALLAYLRWANRSTMVLRSQISRADLGHLVLTPEYATILSSTHDLKSLLEDQRSGVIVGDLIDIELESRITALNRTIDALTTTITRWSGRAQYVVGDSSFWINHSDRIENIDFAMLLDASQREDIRLLFPITVVDELDRLKEMKDGRVRWRAGHTLGKIGEVLSDDGIGILHRAGTTPTGFTSADTIRGQTAIEVILDPPGHTALPNSDDEIIDRALAAQSLAAAPVRFLTYDTGQHTRARMAGLHQPLLFRTDAGTGPEPQQGGKSEQSRGTGSRGRRKDQRDAEAAAAIEA